MRTKTRKTEYPNAVKKEKKKKYPRGLHPNVIKGHWKKGQSGNPLGRTAGTVELSARMRKKLLSSVDGNGRLVADVVIDALISKAIDGSFPHMKELLDRMEGKVPDKILSAVIKTEMDHLTDEQLDTIIEAGKGSEKEVESKVKENDEDK